MRSLPRQRFGAAPGGIIVEEKDRARYIRRGAVATGKCHGDYLFPDAALIWDVHESFHSIYELWNAEEAPHPGPRNSWTLQ